MFSELTVQVRGWKAGSAPPLHPLPLHRRSDSSPPQLDRFIPSCSKNHHQNRRTSESGPEVSGGARYLGVHAESDELRKQPSALSRALMRLIRCALTRLLPRSHSPHLVGEWLDFYACQVVSSGRLWITTCSLLHPLHSETLVITEQKRAEPLHLTRVFIGNKRSK